MPARASSTPILPLGALVRLAAALIAAFSLLYAVGPARAQTAPAKPGAAAPSGPVGSVSGQPIPRFVSLKSDRVNLREGPSKDNRTTWVFQRAGLPVEVLAEYETWRRIRDSEGSEGWVLHSLLSGRRTALVAPWAKSDPPQAILQKADDKSPVVARLSPGVLGNIKQCDGKWCRIYDKGFDGFIAQDRLWGVYPGEKVD